MPKVRTMSEMSRRSYSVFRGGGVRLGLGLLRSVMVPSAMVVQPAMELLSIGGVSSRV